MLRHRLRVAEAMTLIMVARALIARIRFARWRDLLGPVSKKVLSPDKPPALAFACAAAVERAAARLPGTLCLPKAIALGWMLRRRGIAATAVFSVRMGQYRGGLEDLHAWTEIGGHALLDQGDDAHREVLRLGNES